MSSEPFRIRRAEPRDIDALYEICLLTADSGVDATALYSDRKLPGYVWAAPYGELEPDFAFVLDDLALKCHAPSTKILELGVAVRLRWWRLPWH